MSFGVSLVSYSIGKLGLLELQLVEGLHESQLPFSFSLFSLKMLLLSSVHTFLENIFLRNCTDTCEGYESTSCSVPHDLGKFSYRNNFIVSDKLF